MKDKYLEFYKTNFGTAKYCTKSWGLASFEAGAQSRQAEIDAITKQRDSFIKAHHIAMNDVCENKAKIDELQKLRSLDEMAINHLAQANEQWREKAANAQAMSETQQAVIDELEAQLKAVHDSRVEFVEYCRMIEAQEKDND